MDLSEKLERIGACGPAVRWARGRQLPEAWLECDRADWMAWLLSRWSRMDVDRRAVRIYLAGLLFAPGSAGEISLEPEWAEGVRAKRADLVSCAFSDSLREANQVSADIGAIALYLARAERDVAKGYLRKWASEIRKAIPEFVDPGHDWWEAAA